MGATLSYQEVLRTVGNLLTVEKSHDACLVVSEAGVELSPATASTPRRWSMEDLRKGSARQRGWRARFQRLAEGPWQVGQLLRVVGADLDVRGPGPYTLTLHADAVEVRGPAGDPQTYPWLSLDERNALAMDVQRLTLLH